MQPNLSIEEDDEMMNNTFEEAFSNFLDRREYDEAESALFEMVRISFLAGWKAAGGEMPVPQRIFSLVEGGKDAGAGG